MIYNLLKKEAASNWKEAKLKLVKRASYCEERIRGDYFNAFPFEFTDPSFKVDEHFVYEGDLSKPHRIESDFSIYFYSDREAVNLGYRVLQEGEVLQGDNIIKVPAPGNFHIWEGSEWIYKVDLERDSLNSQILTTERELEATQAQITSRKILGMYAEALESKTSELLQKHYNLCFELSKTY